MGVPNFSIIIILNIKKNKRKTNKLLSLAYKILQDEKPSAVKGMRGMPCSLWLVACDWTSSSVLG